MYLEFPGCPNVLFFNNQSSYICFYFCCAACRNPNQEQGQCLSIYDCPPLLSLVQQTFVNLQDRTFLRDSVCPNGVGRTPYVCCVNDRRSEPLESTSAAPPVTPTSSSQQGQQGQQGEGNLLPSPPKCGPHSFGNKVYNGNDTALDEFSWMALLEYVDRKWCLNYNDEIIN